jgi:hypothetical protein
LGIGRGFVTLEGRDARPRVVLAHASIVGPS